MHCRGSIWHWYYESSGSDDITRGQFEADSHLDLCLSAEGYRVVGEVTQAVADGLTQVNLVGWKNLQVGEGIHLGSDRNGDWEYEVSIDQA